MCLLRSVVAHVPWKILQDLKQSSYALEIRICLSKGVDLLQCSSVYSFFFKCCKYFSFVTRVILINTFHNHYLWHNLNLKDVLHIFLLSIPGHWAPSLNGAFLSVFLQMCKARRPLSFAPFVTLFFLIVVFTASQSCKDQGNNSFPLRHQDKLLSL